MRGLGRSILVGEEGFFSRSTNTYNLVAAAASISRRRINSSSSSRNSYAYSNDRAKAFQRSSPLFSFSYLSQFGEKVKELKLDMLCHPNTVLRSIDGYREVSFKELFGKRIMLVLEKFDPKNGFREDPAYTKFTLMLKGRYYQTWGTDGEFEVIRIIIDIQNLTLVNSLTLVT